MNTPIAMLDRDQLLTCRTETLQAIATAHLARREFASAHQLIEALQALDAGDPDAANKWLEIYECNHMVVGADGPEVAEVVKTPRSAPNTPSKPFASPRAVT